MNNTAAVILAGGRGKRMDILCHARPKPYLPFAGKFRVIDFSLSNCIYSRLNDIVVLTDYQRSCMANYLNRWRSVNAHGVNLRILEPKNGAYLGTADAVYQNIDYFKKIKADTVIVLAGDHIYKLDYRKMLAFHRMVNADVTTAVTPVLMKQVRNFGTVSLGADNLIINFIEKSPLSRSNLASMGIYVFNREFLEKHLIRDAGNPLSQHDFGYSLLPEMVKHDRAFAYKFDGYWQDIGTIQAYYDANMELTRERPGFSLNGASPILTEKRHFSSSCITKSGAIINSLVSPGCVVRGRVENSVLSPQVWVEEGAIVKNSVVMGNTFIGRFSTVEGSIIDEGVEIGDHCHIGSDDRVVMANHDITIVGPRIAVPSDTVMGNRGKISRGIGVPDFAAGMSMTVEIASGRSTPGFPRKEVSILKI